MPERNPRSFVLDAATAALVLIAAVVVVHDRVLPALAERARLDPGERIGDALEFRGLATGDTVGLDVDAPSLIVVFRSTCPVCEETAPEWAALARLGADRVFAVGLDADTIATAWVESRIAGVVEAVKPLYPDRFLDRLRIRAVPTTLLFEGKRLALARVGPLQSDDHARIRRAFRDRGVR